ncbi:hypothetical protein B2J88_32140 [Rhodococcus sp. SRB_17]|nr:hypothetical protein [Rhodococcus sp. SRB_17]
MSILNLALHNKTTDINRLPFSSATIVLRSDEHNIRIVRTFTKSRNRPPLPVVDDDSADEFSLTSDGTSLEEFVVYDSTDDEDNWSDSIELINNAMTSPGEIRRSFARRPRVAHLYLPITRISEGILSRFPLHTRDPRLRETDADPGDLRFVNQVKKAWSFYNSKSNAKIRDVQQEGLAEVLAILFGGPVLDYLDRSAQIKSEDSYDLVKSFLAENNIDLQISKGTFIERYENSQEHRAVVGKIEEVRNKVDTILRPQKELQDVIDQMYLGNKHLVFNKSQQRVGRPFSDSIEITVDGTSIPLWALSSGEKQLLQLLLQVLSAGQSIVMIDEPEISLHVDWQERVVNSMRRINPDAQLLLATHSPEIMVDVDDDCVFEL